MDWETKSPQYRHHQALSPVGETVPSRRHNQTDSEPGKKRARLTPRRCRSRLLFSSQFLKHPIGTTYTPSFRLYAYAPVPVSTMRNDGSFIFVVSIFAASDFKLVAPTSINVSPPNLISIRPYVPFHSSGANILIFNKKTKSTSREPKKRRRDRHLFGVSLVSFFSRLAVGLIMPS